MCSTFIVFFPLLFKGVPNQVMRPSELFYKKLTPLLKDKGITNLDNRKEWPPTILQQVLSELIEETPKDLLAKYV